MTAPDGGWDASYQRADPAPWDIGRPQPVFAALARGGLLRGDLLDAGCGTGEHSLLAASCGATVFGVDMSAVAVERARGKAAQRGLSASFVAGDILTLPLPAAAFDVALDSGLFHVFDDVDRPRYVDVIARALRSGGAFYLACFSDRQPGDWGPRRVTEAELRDAFSRGWTVEAIEPAVFDINPFSEASSVQAWFATLRRA